MKSGIIQHGKKKIAAFLAVAVLAVTWVPGGSVSARAADTDSSISAVTGVKFDNLKIKSIYEAEDAKKIGGAKNNTDHPGYSGSGFADNLGTSGSGLEFTVNADEAGRYALSVRYSVGSSGDAATINLYVNGNKQEALGLGALGSWDKWWNRNCAVTLSKGQNTVTLQRENDNANAANIDYITLEKSDFTYIGDCTGIQNNNTSEVTFACTNAAVRVKACDDQVIKIWCEPSGKFYRRYDSFAVENENINPVTINAADQGSYYEFSTKKLTVRVNKAPFSITYLDKQGNVLCQNQQDSMGWNDQNELIVKNEKAQGEHFWGFGEKTEALDKTGTTSTMWSTDFLGAQAEPMVAELGNGRWYMSDPHFISSKGYEIYFDNTSRTQFDMGKTDPNAYSFGSFNPAPGGELCYYFIGGANMKDMTTSFTDLVGKSFFAPEWAYGNMQCHYGYTQDSIEKVAQTYREKNIPCDVMFSDIEWYQNQCSPTEWNKTNFPDPASMLAKLKASGFKFGVIDDPNISAATTSTEDYTTGSANNYFVRNITGNPSPAYWPWGGADGKAESGPSGVLDFFNPSASSWWGSLHTNILNQGIGAFWMDMNEPARYLPDWAFYNQAGKSYGDINELHNVFAIAQNKSMFTKVSQNTSARPFMLTRSGFTGTQRYASPWTGDIQSDWASMSQQLKLGLGLSMSGFSYWGFDIGGFYGNFTDDQYKRWVELSTFAPVHRFHYANWNEGDGNGSSYTNGGKEPWNFGAETISRDQINMRYQMIPYLYSCTADSVIGTGLEGTAGKGTGLPLVRPMVMEYFNDSNTYNMDTQFMCGPSLLVAPVVEDSAVKQVYFPKGAWYDYTDGKTIYNSTGESVSYSAPIDKLPVFVKEGAILPQMPVMQYVGEKPIDKLTLDVYPLTSSGESSFVYYEDDGESQNYKNGDYATTKYTNSVEKSGQNSKLTFTIDQRTGAYAEKVADRSYMLQFHKSTSGTTQAALDETNLQAYSSLSALEAAQQGFYTDTAKEICYVKLHDDAKAHTISIENSVPQEIPLINGGFETGDRTGWSTWSDNDNAAIGVNSDDAYAGSYKCYFYSGSAYKQSIHQTVDNLADGTYQVSAYVKVQYAQPTICRMELAQYDKANGDDAQYTDLPVKEGYQLYKGTVQVTSGKLDIGFYCDSPGGTSVQIDNVTLQKTG